MLFYEYDILLQNFMSWVFYYCAALDYTFKGEIILDQIDVFLHSNAHGLAQHHKSQFIFKFRYATSQSVCQSYMM